MRSFSFIIYSLIVNMLGIYFKLVCYFSNSFEKSLRHGLWWACDDSRLSLSFLLEEAEGFLLVWMIINNLSLNDFSSFVPFGKWEEDILGHNYELVSIIVIILHPHFVIRFNKLSVVDGVYFLLLYNIWFVIYEPIVHRPRFIKLLFYNVVGIFSFQMLLDITLHVMVLV